IGITGGEFRVNSGAWTTEATSVEEGDVVAVRVRSSTGFDTVSTASLTVGEVSRSFNVTTLANNAPTITSPAAVDVSENVTQTTYFVSATDPEGQSITFSLSGPDAALFNLDT